MFGLLRNGSDLKEWNLNAINVRLQAQKKDEKEIHYVRMLKNGKTEV